MSSYVARQAVVVGAGMGGLTAARALADHVEEVIVLERDTLPGDGSPRPGIPQGRHVHALLAGGHRALSALFPNFEDTLVRSGAVRMQVDSDVLREVPGDAVPRRDLGFHSYAQSRPRLEETVRELVRACENITLEDQSRVERLASSDDGRTVDGVVYSSSDGASHERTAELVVDASGRSRLTLDFLEGYGHPVPESTTVGVDMCYSSAVFVIPDDAPDDWKGIFSLPTPPHGSRGGLLLPLEGRRWILSLGGRLGQEPPGDADGFMAFAEGLPFPTIFEAISGAQRVGDIARFRFPESIRRHYARLPSFPGGLLPIADSLCRFNPIYGQGMTVAAQEAHTLSQLLTERTGEHEPLDGLAPAFFAAVENVIDTPWMTAALPDFAYPDTRGERPVDFTDQLRKNAALSKLAAVDAEVHKVLFEVRHLLRPHSTFAEPWLVERMAEAEAAA
jgi:2-polyprenyl-6-methoxyphenol hydroxylase-like FAD-dependent oxidoreductase